MEKNVVYNSLLLLKPTSMCSEHQNNLGMTFFDPKLVENCKSHGQNSFSWEISTKTGGTPVNSTKSGISVEFRGSTNLTVH